MSGAPDLPQSPRSNAVQSTNGWRRSAGWRDLNRTTLISSREPKETKPMTKQELVQRMQDGQAWIPGRRVKIDFGADQGTIMLDGAAEQVTEEDGNAETTIKIGWDDWQQLAAGQLDGMTAFMMGKLKVEGDMSNAMQLQGVFAKLRS
jgi:putative sterol carrier protein